MLPRPGRLNCIRCFSQDACAFDRAAETVGEWRIVNNPLAWGNPQAEVVVLGFSKGPNQQGGLATRPVSEVAFQGGRLPLAKILHHIGLIRAPRKEILDQCIADASGRFHFGSLVRCSVERFDRKKQEWTGTGAGMLDRYIQSPFGDRVVSNCIDQHLGSLPTNTKLVIMLGMGSGGNYIKTCKAAFARALGGSWHTINEVAYSDGKRTFVHTEHFKSQGAHLPNWLSEDRHNRGRFGLLAREAVAGSGVITA